MTTPSDDSPSPPVEDADATTPQPQGPGGLSVSEIETALDQLAYDPASSVHKLLILLASLFLFIGAGLLSSSWQGLTAMVLVLLIHEAGHFVGMKCFGYRDLRMFFIPFLGAAVSGKEINVSAIRKAIVALLGPVPGVVLGIVCVAAYLFTKHEIFLTLGWTFLLINVFNLLPIHPMDGGRLLAVVLFGRHPAAELVFKALGAIALAGMAYGLSSFALGILAYLMFGSLPVNYRHNQMVRAVKQHFPEKLQNPEERIPREVLEAILPDIYKLVRVGPTPRKMAIQAVAVWRKACEPSASTGASIGLFASYAAALFIGLVAIFATALVSYRIATRVEIEQRTTALGETRFVEVHYRGTRKQFEAELNDQGLYDGPSTGWHFSGLKMKEGLFANGYWNGRWRFYDSKGHLTSVIIYDMGKPVRYLTAKNGPVEEVDPEHWPASIQNNVQKTPDRTRKLEVLQHMLEPKLNYVPKDFLPNDTGTKPPSAIPPGPLLPDTDITKKLVGTWSYAPTNTNGLNLVEVVTYRSNGTANWHGTATDKSGSRKFEYVGTWRVSKGYLCTRSRDTVFTALSSENEKRELLSSVTDDSFTCRTPFGVEQTYHRQD